MNFASSRLTVVALLFAGVGLYGACGGSTDLNFVGASSTSSGGGNNGGRDGGGGSGASVGSGASSNGGSGNDTGSGGTNNGEGGDDGGFAGEGGAGGCASRPEVCDDGVDNHCHGLIDCPLFVGGFPENGKAAAGAHVEYGFEEPAIEGATYECRISEPGAIDSATWEECPSDGTKVTPFTATQSQDPETNGLWQIDIRFKFPEGGVSDSFTRRVYTHNSLHGVTRCDALASDGEYLAKAKEYLPGAGAFGAAARVANPFIHLDFDPPVDAWIGVSEGDGIVKPLSLRKRFVRDGSDEYVLMTRVYQSRRNLSCWAASTHVHDRPGGHRVVCSALVFNKKGAGVCLSTSLGDVVLARANNTNYFVGPDYYPDADNLLWRDLLRTRYLGSTDTRLFSPKCFGDSALCAGNELYLPGTGPVD